MHGNAKEVLDDNFLLKEFIKKSRKPAVEKVISFFDFDTTISIRLFLGFFC